MQHLTGSHPSASHGISLSSSSYGWQQRINKELQGGADQMLRSKDVEGQKRVLKGSQKG
jgi:hypothetical protein